MSDPAPVFACTVAGSDPGGGAGLQSDLKTFTALGVWGLSVVTAITAQNSHECRGIWGVPPGAVSLQLGTLLADFEISAFKTGMLWDRGVIREIDDSLPDGVPLVVDPVMTAT
ncbi:MAG: bifunctional hydroxymethylpyrimidine kinase/phosphomethylpyrimidine kinase, partial [Methanoregulaceae archaeon]|nr:bifunctional hydroxymethylpyrimidine kinase/phosphomethylpyrimidine kinase [Methanoregulaceae archaeon]